MVSVVIPVYNGEKYIKAAINSVLKQTYSEIEIIAVDDGSLDNTMEIAKSFSQIRYYRQENKGVSASRNFGMSVARGDYIAFLDADDLYTPDKIEKQVNLLENNADIDVVYNDGTIVDDNLKVIGTLKSEYVLENQADFLACLLFRQLVPVPASIMIRKKCMEDGILYNETYSNAEDYDFIIRLAERYKFGYIPEPLYIYRRHENNLTNAHGIQQKRELDVLKGLDFKKIEKIVEQSSFPLNEKRFLLAKIYYKAGECKTAEKLLTGLAEENFEHPYLWFYLGNCSYYSGKYDKASGYYRKAIQADNSMSEAYNNLACIYAGQDRNEALKLLHMAMEMRPDYLDARHNLEQIEHKQSGLRITDRELRKVLTSYRSISG